MADPNDKAKAALSKSVVIAADKTRAQRLSRIKLLLGTRIDNALALVDSLMAELADGQGHNELWEQLHSAAIRDRAEAALADAYTKCTNGSRMKRLTPAAQAEVFMHAADFTQGVLGDAASAETYLARVLAVVPTHADAFSRLERRYEKLLDARRLLELYAAFAAAPPKPTNIIATQAYNRLLQLTPKDPLSDDACLKLLALVPAHSRLMDALEAHCRSTKRFELACTLLTRALAAEKDDNASFGLRQRLLELSMGDGQKPTIAIAQVEALLARDPGDALALKQAERLLSVRDVASRAAAALQAARRTRI
jgi:hypothetical protein